MDKAAREAEKITREAQDKLETLRMDTELEVIILHREANEAMVKAQVLENAEGMQDEIENVKFEIEKIRIEHTSEYVLFLFDLQKNHSPSPLGPHAE